MRKKMISYILVLLTGALMANISDAAELQHNISQEKTTKTLIVAGGCFWCTESEFQEKKGVLSVTSGFTGGGLKKPSYHDVARGKTGHVEAVEITYNPAAIPYDRLLDIFWHSIDPTDDGGQFYDRGAQYQTVIFYADDAEKAVAEKSKIALAKKLGQPIATRIEPRSPFYAADESHQDYYLKNPIHYQGYVRGSGRKEKIKKIYKDAEVKG
jgi:methionine-S-sulfoxide reductase